MKNGIRPLSRWAGCLFVLALALLFVCPSTAQAQEDYPLPAGPPDTWGQGRQETLPLKTQKGAPGGPLTALPPRGNEAQEQPQARSGQSQEVFTGTKTQVAPDMGGGIPGAPVPVVPGTDAPLPGPPQFQH